MSDHPVLPKAQFPAIIAAKAVEQEMQALEFRGASGQPTAPVAQPGEVNQRIEAKSASRLDEQVSVGRVMKALFPEGIRITDEEQFAIMRLFNAMVASIAQFAQSKMSSPIPIRDVSRHAEMLAEMVRRRTRG